jgi:asparagine synthase (glutamine-hydrolysing)
LRWKNSANITKHLSREVKQQLNAFDPIKEYTNQLSGSFNQLDPVAKAQFIEISIFMSGYLLSSQGDRMAMANSVEGRYPFLDHRIIEFCASLPPDYKLRGLNEKIILKRMMQGKIPDEIIQRSKQAYRAPIFNCFIGENAPEYVQELLSPNSIKEVAIFDAEFVSRLYKNMQSGNFNSETNNMALTAIITTQLLYFQFIKEFNYLENTDKLNFSVRSESSYKKL